MDFWKRVRRIGSALVIALWLIAVAAGSWLGHGGQTEKPLPCTTNCL